MRTLKLIIVSIVMLAGTTAARAAEPVDPCDGPDLEWRIPACTALIEAPDADPQRRATALANRAFSYSIHGEFETAIKDFDAAIEMFPQFAVALNNRAWAYFKWGKISEADVDANRSLALDPASAETLDTRAHVSQWQGDQSTAVRAYDMAMIFGGSRMVGVYQCGLKIRHLYEGAMDGQITPELRSAIAKCVQGGASCDPLPPDEDCGAAS